MSQTLVYIFFIITIFVTFAPVYLQRRKIQRMADEDLKRADYEEWEKQLKSNAYIKSGSRLIWGLFLLFGLVYNFQKVFALGFNWIITFVFILGIVFTVWGISGFRAEIEKVTKI